MQSCRVSINAPSLENGIRALLIESGWLLAYTKLKMKNFSHLQLRASTVAINVGQEGEERLKQDDAKMVFFSTSIINSCK